jgi:hypothetical protein
VCPGTGRPRDGDLAELAGLGNRAVVADDRDRVAGDRPADGARLRDPDRGAGREHEVAFGLAVEFVDGEAERLPAPVEGLGPKGLAAGGYRAEPQVEAPARVRHGAQHAERRRRHEGVAHVHVGDEPERLLRIELLGFARHHRHAEVEARQEHVEEAAGPGPVGRGPEPVAVPRKELVRHLHAGEVSEQHPMAVQRPLRRPRRARGVDHHGGIVGRGVDGREVRACALHDLRQPLGGAVRAVGRDRDLEGRHVGADLREL